MTRPPRPATSRAGAGMKPGGASGDHPHGGGDEPGGGGGGPHGGGGGDEPGGGGGGDGDEPGGGGGGDDPAAASGDDDALTRAFSAQHRASLLGFDWDDPREAMAKVREETAEVAALLPPGTDEAVRARLEEEVGDLLFAVVNVARLAGVDPAAALARATAKFGERFREVRSLAEKRGLPMPGTPLEPLDRLWDEVKGRLGADGRG